MQKVTVGRQPLKNVGGSIYLLIPAPIANAAGLSEEHVAAFEREVLEDGELGKLTIRIETSETRSPKDVN